jgi:DNA-binding LacI/PurR family transcriptional regulator
VGAAATVLSGQPVTGGVPAAAVSRQTVSNVLNGSGRVGEAARARVLDAVAALGYHPHHGARSLRSRRTRQLAYVLPRVQLLPGNYIMQQFLQSLAAACARRDYSMATVVPDGDPRDEMRRLIASRSVDAFLLSELQQQDPRVLLLAEAGFPFACFGRTAAALPQNWVDIDNRTAVAAAVEHVLDRGFGRRITFLGHRSASYWDTERAAGFRDGLARRQIPADQAGLLLVGDGDARRNVRSLLAARRPELRPDAIVTSSDRLAGVVYSVAAELRLRIGQDLAVTGFDGSAAADLMHPRLTSLAIPVDEIARRVAARALRQLDHGPDHEPGEVVQARLQAGESTGGFGREAAALAVTPPAARGGSDAGHSWKRFQGSAVPAGTPAAPGADRRVTIADVAADARVGVGTVSRVLNGSGQVREATQRAVLDSIDRPSHAAATLVRGTPRTVALLVAHLTRPSTVVRVASALAVLEEQGYDTIVCNADSAAERDRHLETLLPTHRLHRRHAVQPPAGRDGLHLLRAPAARVQAGAGRGGHRGGNRPDQARPARRRGRGRAGRGAAEVAPSPVGDLRRVRLPGHRRAGRRGPPRRAGSRAALGGRLRRHRVRGFPGPEHGAAAAGAQRRRGRAAAVRAAARGEGPPAAAGTADRADGTEQLGASVIGVTVSLRYSGMLSEAR